MIENQLFNNRYEKYYLQLILNGSEITTNIILRAIAQQLTEKLFLCMVNRVSTAGVIVFNGKQY